MVVFPFSSAEFPPDREDGVVKVVRYFIRFYTAAENVAERFREGRCNSFGSCRTCKNKAVLLFRSSYKKGNGILYCRAVISAGGYRFSRNKLNGVLENKSVVVFPVGKLELFLIQLYFVVKVFQFRLGHDKEVAPLRYGRLCLKLCLYPFSVP